MKKHVEETFNKLAVIYEHHVDETSLYNSEYERPAMLQELPQDLRTKTVLDAGCAAGWYTEQLVNRGAKVIATDLSPQMVAAAKRRVGSKAEVICLDLEADLPFEDQSFDVIVSSLTLHYIKNWRSTFREFRRILKPTGVLLFSIHHPFMDLKLSENGDYFSIELLLDKWKKQGEIFTVPFYRRPLHYVINETAALFQIEKIVEPQPTSKYKVKSPESYEKLMKNPHFMIVRARKGEIR
ncbi:class I SAM-dependent methyltransferase [Anaerobacillus sp. CMMVII]|uniref:class I SAM-dependent methyltransferase n=1 Tax=Anaerobacillus sp. CMMVII TaxID=2755588 RepID=UPI0021B84D75|nr:class I SAM-dependent methyltransferase [Anaerobacillus sp. CMMVII]MCT8136660.1 class I SAM-dependent methyltransferase [Anaerobacillus sp. CMMVII]